MMKRIYIAMNIIALCGLSNICFAQNKIPLKTQSEINQLAKKTLENISSIQKNLESSKKFNLKEEQNYKNLKFLASRAVRKKYCTAKVEDDIKNNGAVASTVTDKKAARMDYDDRWYTCMDDENEKSRTQLNDAARIVWDSREDVRKIEQTLISAIKYYNAIPGVKPLAIPKEAKQAPLKPSQSVNKK
jgi:hypothetical protein